MGYYTQSDATRLTGIGRELVWQGLPTDADRFPCQVSATQQIDDLAAYLGDDGILIWDWIFRGNWATASNDTPNLLPPVFTGGNNSILYRTQAKNWVTAFSYLIGHRVYNPADTLTYECIVAHTSGATLLTDASKWLQVTGTKATPECRIDYTTPTKAIYANLVRRAWFYEKKAIEADGTGWQDYATLGGLTVYTHAAAEASKDSIFNSYSLSTTQRSCQFHVATNVVVLPLKRMSDLVQEYRWGDTVVAKRLLRDRKILAANGPQSGVSSWSNSNVGLTPANTTRTTTTDPTIGLSWQLPGISSAIRQKALFAATPGKFYYVEAVVIATVDPTAAPGSVALQCTSLDSGGAIVGSAVSVTTAISVSDGKMRIKAIFSDTTAGGATAWAGPSPTWVRFGVIANVGEAGSPNINVSELNVMDNSDRAPTIWKAQVGKTFGVRSFSAEQIALPNDFISSFIAFLNDWEPADKRYFTDTDDPSPLNDGNSNFLVTKLTALGAAEGFGDDCYTNDFDIASGTSSTNGFDETNIDFMLGKFRKFTPVIDGSNYRGNSTPATVVAAANRLKYVNGNPANAVRSNFNINKVGFALEEIFSGVNTTWPITNISVGSGPTYTIRVDAPNHTLFTGAYTKLKGIVRGPTFLNNKTFRVTQGAKYSHFFLSAIIDEVDFATGTIYEIAVNGAGLPAYVSGGFVEQGGNSLEDWSQVLNILTGQGYKYYVPWRAGADLAEFFTDLGASTPDPPALTITAITQANPCEVTTSTAHNLSSTVAAQNRVLLQGILGMTELNDVAFVVGSTPSSTKFTLSGVDSTNFQAYTSGGNAYNARQYRVNRKLGLFFGWSDPVQPPPLFAHGGS